MRHPSPATLLRRSWRLGAAAVLLLATPGTVRADAGRPGQAAAARSIGAASDSAAVADALRERLARRGGSLADAAWTRAERLYTALGMRPLWMNADGRLSDRGTALAHALASAEQHGLPLGRYPIRELDQAIGALVAAGTIAPERVGDADALLTASYAAFAADLLVGRVDPRVVEPMWHISARAIDVDSALAGVLERAGTFGAALAALHPKLAGYDDMIQALGDYRAIVRAGGWPTVARGATLRGGDRDARVPVLRRRLAIEGYRTGASFDGIGASGDSSTFGYDSALAGVVGRFQARHGLTVDSAVGPRTLASLNVSAEHRRAQLVANLERLRWLPHALGDRFILVNVPAFRLDAYDGGERALTMRVVVGSELDERHTPVFSDSMEYVQFGPYWNVPRGIAVREILPHARRDRGYLDRNDYELVRGWGDGAPVVNARALSNAALFSSRYRVRQRPGPANALGRVKFIFPNDYAVYLHDTPARSLFDEARRAYSHGCVRVADPAALAEFVLSNRTEWDRERIDGALRAGERVRVDLRRKLPVYLVYLTSFVRDGEVAFRSDVYDMDSRLMRALGDPKPDGDLRASADRLAALR